MAKPKARNQVPGEAIRPVDPAATGGGAVDPDAACDTAIGLIVTDLARLKSLVETSKRTLTESEGAQVANYARTLSAIATSRRRTGKTDDLGDKSLEELAEMAKGIPGLRDLLGGE